MKKQFESLYGTMWRKSQNPDLGSAIVDNAHFHWHGTHSLDATIEALVNSQRVADALDYKSSETDIFGEWLINEKESITLSLWDICEHITNNYTKD